MTVKTKLFDRNTIFMVGSSKSQFNVPHEKWIIPNFDNWNNDTDINSDVDQYNSTTKVSVFYDVITIPLCELPETDWLYNEVVRDRELPIHRTVQGNVRSTEINVTTELGKV